MARYRPISEAAQERGCHPRTIENWMNRGFIRGYSDGSKRIQVDLDEIERAYAVHPEMRGGRKRFSKATIVPLPIFDTDPRVGQRSPLNTAPSELEAGE